MQSKTARACCAGLLAPLIFGCGNSFETSEPIKTVKAAASHSFDAGMDWPQWRGPARDGVSRETDLAPGFGPDGPVEIWRRPVGDGYSGMAVAEGRLYTMEQGDAEHVVALDAKTGRQVWRFRSDKAYYDGQGDGPRGTPTYDDGMLYSVGAQGMFHALDAKTGQPLWSHDLVREFGGSRPTWGFSTSPLVEGAAVYVEPGGSRGRGLAGFDKKTGELVWSRYSDAPGYSSPIAATINGLRQILFFTSRHLVSVSPPAEKINWEFPWKTSYDVNAATPIFVPPDRIFISSGYGVGAALLRVRGTDAVETIWKSRVMKNHFNSSVLHESFIYGFDDGTLKCIRAENGETQWRKRGFGKGSLIVADGRLIILGERGTLALAEATPEAYRELARAQVLKGRCWTSPTLARGKLYLRNQREIVCLAMDG